MRPKLLALAVPAAMVLKGLCIFGVARMLKSPPGEAIKRAVLMAQGGEFAFVLYSAAASAGVIDAATSARLTAIIVLSMALTPLAIIVLHMFTRAPAPSLDGIEEASGLSGSVLVVGFGRFGQVVSQALLARDADVTIIDSDVDQIRTAERFGFKITTAMAPGSTSCRRPEPAARGRSSSAWKLRRLPIASSR